MRFETKAWSLAASSRGNQDSHNVVLLNDRQLLIAAIADGVGGNAGGEIASQTAIDTATASLATYQTQNFFSLFVTICENLAAKASEREAFSDMATTMTAIVATANTVRFGHVGDTRIYHLRGDGLVQKTKDQTEASLLVEQGIITPRKARTYARKSVLTSALSPTGTFDIQQDSFNILPQDRILMLSDGLYRNITKLVLRDMSKSNRTIEDFSNALYERFVSQQLEDDASIILIEVAE